jgi:hypothetical protein
MNGNRIIQTGAEFCACTDEGGGLVPLTCAARAVGVSRQRVRERGIHDHVIVTWYGYHLVPVGWLRTWIDERRLRKGLAKRPEGV